MPAFCTHYAFMKDMESKLKNELGFELNTNIAAIGTQGPDIFFFQRVLPFFMPGRSGRKTGSLFHRSKPENIFNCFAEYVKKTDNEEIAKSYIYGFIMHYALDRTCHPYVYAYVDIIKRKKRFVHSGSIHNEIEMGIDAYILHKKFGIENAKCFDSASTINPSKHELDVICKLISNVSESITGRKISEKDAKHAIKDTIKMQRLLRDKHSVLKPICIIFETLLAPFTAFYRFSSMIKPKGWKSGLKYVNIEKGEWRSPYKPQEMRQESFDELYGIALDDALTMIKGFEEILKGNADAENLTGNISFLTGCEVI